MIKPAVLLHQAIATTARKRNSIKIYAIVKLKLVPWKSFSPVGINYNFDKCQVSGNHPTHRIGSDEQAFWVGNYQRLLGIPTLESRVAGLEILNSKVQALSWILFYPIFSLTRICESESKEDSGSNFRVCHFESRECPALLGKEQHWQRANNNLSAEED